MKDSIKSTQSFLEKARTNTGFTLIELMVALVVGAIVITIIYSIYTMQQRSFKRETMIVRTQQNARSALIFMERDIRMAGYDRLNTDLFSITDIREDADGNGTLTFTADILNADNGVLDTGETFTYELYDAGSTSLVGNLDLSRTDDLNGQRLVAAGIEALGFAFAFDSDADGMLDTAPAGHVIWAVDSDGDNDLDLNLETNGDGEVNTADGTETLNSIGYPDVDVSRIRAIKIFLLARTKGMDLSYSNNENYRVGRQVVSGNGDQFRRRLLVTTVKCRNMGL
jgi:type IV pilus assembly protein PilW